MPSSPPVRITVGFRDAALARDLLGRSGDPRVIECVAGQPHRLSDPWMFAQPPDLFRVRDTVGRLALLRDRLLTFCGTWDKGARLFLHAYFEFVALAAVGSEELAALAEAHGGLFQPADWSFCALRPLPLAFIATSEDEPAAADVAFWTGDQAIAVRISGFGDEKGQRASEERLRAADVTPVAIELMQLQRAGAALLAETLPPPLQRFWQDQWLPLSPFGTRALREDAAS